MEDLKNLKLVKRGSTICVLASENQATKLAFKMALALTNPETDHLHLVTCVLTDDGRHYAEVKLNQLADSQYEHCITRTVIVKAEDSTLCESIAAHMTHLKADLVVLGSHALCAPANPAKSTAPQYVSTSANPPSPNAAASAGSPKQLGRSISSPYPGMGSLTLRMIAELRSIPVLVVKVNSKGPFLHHRTVHGGLRCMLDLQANSRHVMDWLMDRISPSNDNLILTVCKAYEGPDKAQAKPSSMRLLNTFSVQAAVNSYAPEKRMLKEQANRSLPQAVMEDAVDILAVQGPRCRGLSPQLMDLLFEARTSILIWPPDRKARSLGRSWSM